MHTAAGTCVGMEPSPLQYSARNTLSNAFIVSTINYTDTTNNGIKQLIGTASSYYTTTPV